MERGGEDGFGLTKTFLFLLFSFFCSQSKAQDVLFLSTGSNVYVSTGASLYVAGGLQAAVGSTLYNEGEISLTDNQISFESNWTDYTQDGVLALSPGVVTLNGTHVITNGRFFNLKVATLGHAQLNSDLAIFGSLTLTAGVVRSGAYELSLQSDQANSLIAGPGNNEFINSYIEGRFSRGIASNEATYFFPVSRAGVSHSNVLQFLNHNLVGPTLLEVRFIEKPGTDAALSVSEFGVDYTSVNTFGVWNIKGDASPSSGSFDLKASIFDFTTLVDNNFALLYRPEQSLNALDWSVPIGSTIPQIGQFGRTVVDGIAIRRNLSALGQYGIGQSLIPLPIELLHFNGRRSGMAIVLSWATTHEVEVDYFVVERLRRHATSFAEIARVGARNENSSSTTNYQVEDTELLPGKTYYRLKIIERNGDVRYSDVIAISNDDHPTYRFFPNPTDRVINLEIATHSKGAAHFMIYNSLGQPVLERTIQDIPSNGIISLDFEDFAAGTYFLRYCDSVGNCSIFKFFKI